MREKFRMLRAERDIVDLRPAPAPAPEEEGEEEGEEEEARTRAEEEIEEETEGSLDAPPLLPR